MCSFTKPILQLYLSRGPGLVHESEHGGREDGHSCGKGGVDADEKAA